MVAGWQCQICSVAYKRSLVAWRKPDCGIVVVTGVIIVIVVTSVMFITIIAITRAGV